MWESALWTRRLQSGEACNAYRMFCRSHKRKGVTHNSIDWNTITNSFSILSWEGVGGWNTKNGNFDPVSVILYFTIPKKCNPILHLRRAWFFLLVALPEMCVNLFVTRKMSNIRQNDFYIPSLENKCWWFLKTNQKLLVDQHSCWPTGSEKEGGSSTRRRRNERESCLLWLINIYTWAVINKPRVSIIGPSWSPEGGPITWPGFLLVLSHLWTEAVDYWVGIYYRADQKAVNCLVTICCAWITLI